jgi:WD40 repeat protein
VWLFDAANLKAVPRLFETFRARGWSIPCAAYSPDGRLIAGSDGNVIRVWNAQTGELVALLEGHSNAVTSLAFSPDSRFLASGSGDWETDKPDYSVRLWNLSTGQGRIIGVGKLYAINVAFSPDGKLLAAEFGDETARVWVADTGKEPYQIQRPPDPGIGLAFSPDGAFLATAESYGFSLWNAETGVEVIQVKVSSVLSPPYVSGIVFTPDSRSMIFGSRGHGVMVWNAESRQLEDHSHLSSLSDALSISLSPDGKTLAVIGSDSVLRVWDWAADTEIAAVTGYMGSIFGLSLNGTQAAYGSSLLLDVRDLESGNLVHQIDTGLDLLGSVLYSPDAKTLVYAGSATLRVRSTAALKQVGIQRVNAETGDALPTLGSSFYSFFGLAFSPDGRWLAGANPSNNEVRLWDLTQQPLVDVGQQRLHTMNVLYNNVGFTPDGELLVVAGQEGYLATWNLNTEELHVLQERAPGQYIFDDGLAISPDGKTLAVAYDVVQPGTKSFVQLMDIETGQVIRTLEQEGENIISDVNFSEDGVLLATAVNGHMYLWDVTNGASVYVTPANAEVTTIAFDADGRFIVTGGSDGLVRVWGVR